MFSWFTKTKKERLAEKCNPPVIELGEYIEERSKDYINFTKIPTNWDETIYVADLSHFLKLNFSINYVKLIKDYKGVKKQWIELTKAEQKYILYIIDPWFDKIEKALKNKEYRKKQMKLSHDKENRENLKQYLETGDL